MVDHVEALPLCDLKTMNAFFQMSSGALNVTVDDESYPEAVLTHRDGSRSRVMWRTGTDKNTMASSNPVQDAASPSGTRDSQYLNISAPLSADRVTQVAYVFAGPGPSVEPPQFTTNSSNGYIVQVKVDGVAYSLAVSTQHNNLTGRTTYLGHTGYATLTTGESSEVTYFGYDRLNFPVKTHSTRLQETIDVHQLQRSIDYHNALTIFLVLTVVTCCLVGLQFWYHQKTASVLLVLPLAMMIVAILFVLVMLHSVSFLPKVLMVPPTGFQYESSNMPSVFVSSMEWGGSEMVGELFATSDDFVYAQVPGDLNVPTAF